MTARPPSRLALAIFDRLVGNEPLKGDLVEEFAYRQSQWWLWRQVIGAAACGPKPGLIRHPQCPEMLVLGAAVLVLVSFEAVFVTNLLHRLMFGPEISEVAKFAYLKVGDPDRPIPPPLVSVSWASLGASAAAISAAIGMGWVIAPFHHRHYALSLPLFSISVMLNAALNLRMPFELQVLTSLLFVLGLVVGGWLSVPSAEPPRVRLA